MARAGVQEAAKHSCGKSDALSGLCLLHFGEAYAMLGEHRQCESALSAAEASFGQIKDDDPAAHFYSPTQLGRLAGSCYLFLGHPERAEPLLDATATALHARGGGGLTVVFGAARELYPWRNEQPVHNVQDRLLALMAQKWAVSIGHGNTFR